MTTREVILEGGSPWGFRLHGGVDTRSPLRISRVNSSGKAALRGIREGDILTSINGHPTDNLTYTDAHGLIKNSQDPLRLELTLETGSPRQRKRNRTISLETHSETLKSTSRTSYSKNSTKTIYNDENEYADPDQYLRKESSVDRYNHSKDHLNPPLSPDSTVSSNVSSCSTLTEAGEEPFYESPNLTSSLQISAIMADSANKSRKKRSRNQRRRQKRSHEATADFQSHIIQDVSKLPIESDKKEDEVEEEYKVDFPETNTSKPKLNIKSKSLDDDDESIKIQEVEGSGEDDKHQCEAIVSEADSDWEETTDLRVPQTPVPLSTVAISIDNEPLQRISNVSPEEELSLRNFLEGINLVNSPECQSGTSTLDSMKIEKSRKREALVQYFTPFVHNPRFLDIISEEGSDLSDREVSSVNRHLKQGTPEMESMNEKSTKLSPRNAKRNKLRRSQVNKNEEKAVLVCTKLVDTPSLIEPVHTCASENSKAEKVFLESSSDNASSETSSDTGKTTPSEIVENEEEEREEEGEPDVTLITSESNQVNKKQLIFEEATEYTRVTTEIETLATSQNTSDENSFPMDPQILKNNNLTQDKISNTLGDFVSQNEHESQSIQTVYAELTPPPTPQYSPKKKLSTDNSVDSDLEESMKEIVVDTAKEIKSVLHKLSNIHETNFIVNHAIIPSPEKPISQCFPLHSPSVSSSSSGKTSPSTVKYNPMTSSIADVASIATDLELAKEATFFNQPLSLRQICMKFLMTSQYGIKILQELSEVSLNLEKLSEAGNEKKEKLLNAASLNLMKSQDANKSTLISETTEKLKRIMSSKKWAGLPFYNNPKLLFYLTPSQGTHLGKSDLNENEPETVHDNHNLLSKNSEKMSSGRTKSTINHRIDIESFEKETFDETHDFSYSISTSRTLPRNFKQTNDNPRLQVSNLDEWLDIARGSGRLQNPRTTLSQDEQYIRESTRTKCRRTSLPEEIHQRQLEMILNKEKEIERELENLLEEKRKLYVEMTTLEMKETNSLGQTGNSYEKQRPKSFPQSPSETLRQKMYEEYMKQVAEREERKHHKMIKLTSTPSSKNIAFGKSQFEAVHPPLLEDEFMKKVQERHGPLEKVEEEAILSEEKCDINTSSVLLIDGTSVKEAIDLPKHLKEFVAITVDTSNGEKSENCNGIWSPGQKQESAHTDYDKQKQQQKNEESLPSVWQPKSATSSPVAGRKEYRPISFESPKLGRRNQSEEFQVHNRSEKPTHLPLQDSIKRGDILHTSASQRSIPNSRSTPAAGFAELTTSRLPRAQNPTVTLLQKAREGQLSKGANYLENNRDHYRVPHNPNDQGEISNPRRNEYYSESDSEIIRGSDISRRKIEGVGPVSSDGMPLSLRSEVRDANQSKWYKKMYDTIHKQKPYRDEFVTVRYKPRRAQYPYISGYLSEPEPGAYDSDHVDYKYATLDRRRMPMNEKENFATYTMPRNAKTSASDYSLGSKLNPGRIENYTPGRQTISDQESKKWWDEVMDIFDGKLDDDKKPIMKGYMSQALKESGYESDSTLVFRKKEDSSQISPSEQREVYKIIQKGGDIPLHGLRKPAPERPKEPEPPVPPPKGYHGQSKEMQEGSPRKYVENQVTIHYKTPVRQEIKDYFSEDELAHRQQEAMKKMYQEERRRKYLQVSNSYSKSFDELQDMHNRRHTDNFIPSQKSPIPLNRYDDFDDMVAPQHKIRPRSPEPRLVAKALYNFVGMTPRELTFRKGDNIYVRRQIDKNWYEGELNAMVGLFPVNYVEIVPYENVKSTTRKPHEGQARAKYNFLAKTHLELSLAKGEMVIITRRVDNNWYEGKIGGRKGIFPASYVDILIDPQEPPKENPKPVASPAAHSLLLNGSSVRESMGSHTYTPNIPNTDQASVSSYYAKPVQVNYCNTYGGRNSAEPKNPVNQALHIDTQTAEPIPFKALYKYMPQNDDELELMEGDTVFVLEKCDDGWYVGSNERTGAFGTFPGNYVDKA